MRALNLLAASGALLAALASPLANAAPGGACGPDGYGPMAMRGGDFKDFKARAERRLEDLKAGLKLRADQEGAWKDFRGTLAAQAGRMEEHFRAWRESAPHKTAVERLEHAQKGADERRAALDQLTTATKTFYAVLDDEQKAFFDRNFRMMPDGGRHGPRRGRAS